MSENEWTFEKYVHGLKAIRDEFDAKRVIHSQLKAAWFISDPGGVIPATAMGAAVLPILFPNSTCEYDVVWATDFCGRKHTYLTVALFGEDRERSSFKDRARVAGSEISRRPHQSVLSSVIPDTLSGGYPDWFQWVAYAVAVSRSKTDPRVAIEQFGTEKKTSVSLADLAAKRPELRQHPDRRQWMGWTGLEPIGTLARFDQRRQLGRNYGGPPLVGWQTVNDLWTFSVIAMDFILEAAGSASQVTWSTRPKSKKALAAALDYESVHSLNRNFTLKRGDGKTEGKCVKWFIRTDGMTEAQKRRIDAR